jgi:hypothetical protein
MVNNRFTSSVFPSVTDDVMVSPYNCAFSLNKLINHADCVFPFDNTSLIKITQKAQIGSKDKPGDSKSEKTQV